MGRPRKHEFPHGPAKSAVDYRDAYLERIRSRIELYKAKEVADIIGIDVDAVYALGLPGFNPGGERRNRWDGYTLADYLDRHKTGTAGTTAYLTKLEDISYPLSASSVSQILGLHSDVVPFLGLPSTKMGARGKRYSGTDLAAWLEIHRIGGDHAD